MFKMDKHKDRRGHGMVREKEGRKLLEAFSRAVSILHLYVRGRFVCKGKSFLSS